MQLIKAALVPLAAAVAVVLAGPAAAARITVGLGESIQAAVDAASPGDTIVVQPGTYNQNVLITKDRITLVGRNAVLEPPVSEPACVDEFEPELLHGICVFGEADAEGNVTDAVDRVSVGGFTIRNFDGFGIYAFGTSRATFARNIAANNGEYGIAAFATTGTRILQNVTYGSFDAGIYVGDSPDANALVSGNDSHDNLMGVFQRNATGLTIERNNLHGNCMGVLVLADAPGPAGETRVRANRVSQNTKACPALEEEGFPPTSGIGVLLLGAHDVKVTTNVITGNVPSGPTAFSGGVVVMTGIGGTAPSNVVVRQNLIRNNDPDLFWDETGTASFAANRCETSVPGDLCD